MSVGLSVELVQLRVDNSDRIQGAYYLQQSTESIVAETFVSLSILKRCTFIVFTEY